MRAVIEPALARAVAHLELDDLCSTIRLHVIASGRATLDGERLLWWSIDLARKVGRDGREEATDPDMLEALGEESEAWRSEVGAGLGGSSWLARWHPARQGLVCLARQEMERIERDAGPQWVGYLLGALTLSDLCRIEGKGPAYVLARAERLAG